MMRSIIKKLTHPFLKKGLQWHYRKPRKYHYDAIEVLVHPDVFPPHLTISTRVFLDFIQSIKLEEKSFLELGCGSGIIALYACKKGAKVTATDINHTALSYLKEASVKNQLPIEIILSDLFENLEGRHFDYVLINPPYYPREPKNVKEQAWFCGKDFRYFKRLFVQLPPYILDRTEVLMILSEDCALDTIKQLAQENNLQLLQIFSIKVKVETNYIFKIVKRKLL